MKRFITYGSTNQFKQTISSISRHAQFVEIVDGQTKYNKDIELPIVTAIGTEKIHGTNAAVCYSNEDGFWVQSRKNIITFEKDNNGCAVEAYKNEEEWMKIINSLALEHTIDLDCNVISVYFEWAGGNIQKTSACSGVDKRVIY